jgi:hypothetical protein
MNQNQDPKLNINLKNTEILKSEDGNVVFSEGIILRKASKFLTGTSEDAIVPIPIFYDVISGRILKETLPKDIQDEYNDYI